jgi:hypothetical protein
MILRRLWVASLGSEKLKSPQISNMCGNAFFFVLTEFQVDTSQLAAAAAQPKKVQYRDYSVFKND